MAVNKINFIEGSGINILIEDNPTMDCVDIAIGVAPMSVMPTPSVGNFLYGPVNKINFIEGTGISITVDGEDITIALA